MAIKGEGSMSVSSLRMALVICAGAAVMAPVLWAQAKGGGQQQPGPAPGGSTTPGRTPTPTPTPTPQVTRPQQEPTFTEMPRPIYLSGRVMMDDGTPPPDRIVIQRVCNGIARPEGYTDAKGRFSFELGRNSRFFPDASIGTDYDPFDTAARRSASTTPGEQSPSRFGSDNRLNGCELTAVLPGFRSDSVILTGRHALDNPEVGTIVLHRIGGVEGTVISLTSLQAPKDAQKAYEKGLEANRDRKWQKAQKELEKAVAVYPKYAAAWYELGYALQYQKQIEEARKAYARSLEADPKYIKPYLQLAYLDAGEKKWQEVADTTDRMVRLNPIDFPQAYFLNSVANLNLHKPAAAEKSALEALRRDPGHRYPQAEQILGLALASQGDFAGAIPHIEAYLELAPNANNADLARRQLEDMRQRAAQQTTNRPKD